MMELSFLGLSLADSKRVVEVASGNIVPAWSQNDYEHFLASPSAVCVGAFSCGEMKAFFLGLLSGEDLDVVAIATDKKEQGKGIASKLLEEVLKSPGILRATLEVDPGNEPAVKLYLSKGFSVVGLRKKYYEGKRDAWLMKWER
jgi:ribosomal-protein-alanine N-acetyltransferase